MNVGGCLLKEIIQLTDKRTQKLRQQFPLNHTTANSLAKQYP